MTKTIVAENNNNNKKVVVFGATGAVGSALVDIISKNQPSWKILAVTRRKSSDATLPSVFHQSNVTITTGDVESVKDVKNIVSDIDIIYACIGFKHYERKYWSQHWPVVVENLLTIAADTRTKLVFCDNLYAYGWKHDKVTTSCELVAPSMSSKPAIRSQLRRKFQQFMKLHPSLLTVVGGSDFFGPNVTDMSFMGDTFTKNILDGKAPLAIGSATKIHDFCYVPDFANALYVASLSSDAYGKFWICPHAVHNKTMKEISVDVARLAGITPAPKISVLPTFGVYLMSPFMGIMKEMVEMLPFWTNDYHVDDHEFCKTFQVEATPYDEALGSYIAFYKKSNQEG